MFEERTKVEEEARQPGMARRGGVLASKCDQVVKLRLIKTRSSNFS